MTESENYDLNASRKGLGKLCPILKDAHGNIIDGFHRQNSDPDWPFITVSSVSTPKELELARLAVNFCRRTLPPAEFESRLRFLIQKCKMKPEEISRVTGIALRTIYDHAKGLINEERSQAIKNGISKRKESAEPHISREIQDTTPTETDPGELFAASEETGELIPTPETDCQVTTCPKCGFKFKIDKEA